ncbi:MAG: dNTP triphosphohydrolase [Flavobacteriaceae bacterium]|nr:dNTP triphosphohydrolase [Flavobacteriaceae bacterium]
MNWINLLSISRFGDASNRLRIAENSLRTGFEKDYDRIVFSSEFRSLQDKTQVIPLSRNGFVHTRLTHSHEVSVVGRSLGRVVGKGIVQKYPELQEAGYIAQDFGSIVAAAALAHDIGNPPFGHSGEKAISDFYLTGFGSDFKNLVEPQEWQDLINFEGNAHGFYLLNKTSAGIPKGLRLSYATLGAFTKYPRTASHQPEAANVAYKKHGYFQIDAFFFEEMATALKLQKEHRTLRHPMAFLVEAADDICYTIIDFEDGINLGWISEDFALEYLIKLVKDNIITDNYHKLATKKDRIAYLRALSIQSLIEEARRIFLENEAAILSGDFKKPLLEHSIYKAQIKDIINISISNIYRNPEVIEKEIKGYKLIHGVLEALCSAYRRNRKGSGNAIDKLIMSYLGPRLSFEHEQPYYQLLEITSFVASLSDGQLLDLYQRIYSV